MRTKFTSITLIVTGCLTLLSTVPAHLRAATLTVTSAADSGPGTLRAALATAANGDTIDASGVTGTILLTSGELLVTNSVTILGPGPANLAVNGDAVSRVFHIALSNTVTIASLTITNGKTSGGYPTSSGGGIYNDGYSGSATLVVSTSTLSNNSVSGSGGGIYNDGTSSGNGMLTVSASILSSNSASYGGGVYNDGYSGSATLQVLTSTLSGNSVSNRGGGIYNNSESSGNGTLIVSNSTLRGNSTSGNNGGGGGIYSDGASSGNAKVTVITSTLSGNLAGANNGGGGGIYNDGEFSGNATLLVSASTLSSNSAIASNGGGGGIYNNGGFSGTGTVQIANSILNAGAVGENIANASGTVSSDGYNLSSDDGGGFLTATADQINTDPMLGPLQNNGGPTFTHALLPGSPAIDKGTNSSGSATDQRGRQRLYDNPSIANASGGDGTDIGAFELNPPLLNIARSANSVVLSWSINDTGYTLQSAPSISGTFTNVPGATNPATNPITGAQRFYRLIQ